MEDYIIRGTAAADFIRAFAVATKGITAEARERHHMSRTACAALGRTMAAALMMAEDLKNESDLLTIEFDGDGPLGKMIVTATGAGTVRGCVDHPQVMLPPNKKGKLDVGGAVGRGRLMVIKDLGLREPYNGFVDIVSGEIAEDIAWYYASSEQVPSVVSLGVLVDSKTGEVRESGGFMIQLLPDCPDEIAAELEEKCASLPPVTEMLSQGMTPEDILSFVLRGMDPVVRGRRPVSFRCGCTREKVTKTLLAMGAGELRSLIAEEKPVTLNCGFCNTDYTFSTEELRLILREAEKKRRAGRNREDVRTKDDGAGQEGAE